MCVVSHAFCFVSLSDTVLPTFHTELACREKNLVDFSNKFTIDLEATRYHWIKPNYYYRFSLILLLVVLRHSRLRLCVLTSIATFVLDFIGFGVELSHFSQSVTARNKSGECTHILI